MSPLLHFATVRCGANVWSLLEVKRTFRARRGRVDPTRLTQRDMVGPQLLCCTISDEQCARVWVLRDDP